MPRSLIRLLIPIAAVASFGAACGDDRGTGPADGSGSTIDVSLADDGITLSETEVPSASITFSATNEGTLTHEIEVFEGEKDPASLPIQDHVADTEGWTLVDEIEDITPGSTADLTLDLQPGTYQIVCNLSGHFENGMHATMIVS